MSRVLLFPQAKTQSDWVNETVPHMNNAVRIAVAMEMPNGEVWTGYWDCNAVQKQTMVSHMQIDIIHQSMTATYDMEPIE